LLGLSSSARDYHHNANQVYHEQHAAMNWTHAAITIN
jgi:hypothetical protein